MENRQLEVVVVDGDIDEEEEDDDDDDEEDDIGIEHTLKDRLQLHEAILENRWGIVDTCIYGGADPNLDLDSLDRPSLFELEKTEQLKRKMPLFFRQSSSTPVNFALCNVWNQLNKTTTAHFDFRLDQALQILGYLMGHDDVKLTLECPNFTDFGQIVNQARERRPTMELALHCVSLSQTNQQRTAMTKVIAILTRGVNRCIARTENKRIEEETKKRKANGQVYRCALLDEMRHDTETHDVTFACPDGKTVTAHKSVLMSSIPYFKAAFSTNWKESTTYGEWRTDKPSHVMKQIVDYIYTGNVNFDAAWQSDEDNKAEGPPKKKICNEKHTRILKVFSVAHEYQMENLLDICQKRLISILSTSNLVDILKEAAHLDASGLKRYCFKFMKENSLALFSNHNIAFFAAQHEALWKEFQEFVAKP